MMMFVVLSTLCAAAGFVCGFSSFEPVYAVPSLSFALVVAGFFARRALVAVDRRVPSLQHPSESLGKGGDVEGASVFFEAREQLDVLKRLVPNALKAKSRKSIPEIRVWCVTRGQGEDAFSAAMVLREAVPYDSNVRIKMLATIPDFAMPERQPDGLFTRSDIESVPGPYRKTYLVPMRIGSERSYQIHPRLLEFIRFAPFDLTTDPYPFRFPFDYIICRGVLADYNDRQRRWILNRLTQSLAPGGHLFVLPTESFLVSTEALALVAPGIFRRQVKDLTARSRRPLDPMQETPAL